MRPSVNECVISSDVLHPNRPNVSKDDLRIKLAELYKSSKEQISVFGFRTQYGGGKSTGFALIYDSEEALKKFEPHYRLVRIGKATKIEKASRQQRRFDRLLLLIGWLYCVGSRRLILFDRQTTQESFEDSAWYCEDQGCNQRQEEISGLVRFGWLSGSCLSGEEWVYVTLLFTDSHLRVDDLHASGVMGNQALHQRLR